MFSTLFAMTLTVASAHSGQANAEAECFNTLEADKTVVSLADVPTEIGADLTQRLAAQGSLIATYETPLAKTDAPTAVEKQHARVRFVRAIAAKDRWFVQLEVAEFAGVQTFTYSLQSDGRFTFAPAQHFGGPACASIKAALANVTAFGPI